MTLPETNALAVLANRCTPAPDEVDDDTIRMFGHDPILYWQQRGNVARETAAREYKAKWEREWAERNRQ